MKDTLLVVALSSKEEGEAVSGEFKNDPILGTSLFFPATLEEADSIISTTENCLVLLDGAFSQGKLLEDLLMFPRAPFVLIASVQDTRTLEKVVALSGSDFIIRLENYQHLTLLKIVIRKTLKDLRFTDWQNRYLKISEEKYKNLLQALPDIVYTLDEEGYFTFVNDSIQELGYKPEELIGKHFSEILDSADYPLVSRREVLPLYDGKCTGNQEAPKLFDERRGGERKTKNLELRLKRKQRKLYKGEEMYVTLTAFGDVCSSGYYTNIEEGKIFRGTVGIIRDITSKKRSETMIQKLFNAVDQTPASVLILETDGRVDYTNSYFLRHDGFSPEEVLGKKISELLTLESPCPWKEIFESLKAGKSVQKELRIKRRSGVNYWGLFLISPISIPPGKVTSILLIAEDITTKKRMEELCRESLLEKEKLLKEVHHRVKNNLQVVSSILSLQSDYAINKEYLKLLVESQTRINSMAYLHEQLYHSDSISKIEMYSYFNSIKEQYTNLYNKAVEIRLEFPGGDLQFDIDQANPLGLIVNELLSNSLEHAFPGVDKGHITIKMDRAGEGGYILEISDNGRGLPRDMDPHAPSTLGLTLVNNLVEQLNGKITYSSGKGTRVSLLFSA